MYKCLLLLISILAMSCKENTAIRHIQDEHRNENTGTTENQIAFGIWSAHIEYTGDRATDAGRLIVIGTIEPERQGAKVILIKPPAARQTKPGTLILYLSKRPISKAYKSVTVNYTEILEQKGQYGRVEIQYNKNQIAVINNIDDIRKYKEL
jgi:hypothetical protein